MTAQESPAERAARRQRRADGEALLLEVAADLLTLPGTSRSRMFGADAVLAGGKVVGFVDAEGALVVKLPADRATALVDAGAATRMRMGRGEAREWVGIPQPDPDDPEAVEVWRQLVHASHTHVTGA